MANENSSFSQKEYERAYGERQVPQFLLQMVDRYGIERYKIVIASTIQLLPHDGRYSQDRKEAAAKVAIPGKNTELLHDLCRSSSVLPARLGRHNGYQWLGRGWAFWHLAQH